MSILEQDVPAHHLILNQQEISVLNQRETESLKTKRRAEEPKLVQVKEEENESELWQFAKKKDRIVLKQEQDTSMATVYGSLEIKEEPEGLELQLIKYDCQSEPQPMVKIEVEDIIKNENQFVLKQETDTSMVSLSGPFYIKGEPVELEPKQVKEEQHGSGPQLARIEIECMSKKENQFVQQTDAIILMGYDKEKDHQQPEANGNQTPFQNIPKGDHRHKVKTLEALRASGDKQQQQRGLKTRGQRDNVQKGMKGKKIDKVKKCKQCKVCGKSFKCSLDLTVHMRTHTGEMPSSSISCGKDSKDKSSLKSHTSDTVEKRHTCEMCGKCFNKKRNLNKHIRTHTEEKPFSCKICGKGFKRTSHLKTHEKTHTGEKPFSCKTCGKCFNNTSNLRRHMRTHTGEKPFSCHTCGKCFNHKSNLRRHMRTHTGEKPFSCISCGKCYRDKSGLNNHMISHTGLKPVSFLSCGKCFNPKNGLNSQISHTGEKPLSRTSHTGDELFLCKTCGKGYKDKSSLNSHMRTHTGEKPFWCRTCGKCFSHKSSLNIHMRIHTGEKPHSCKTCGKGFKVKSGLESHMRTHTGEKPFSCISCGKGFSHKCSLISHIRTHTQ